jgi:pheromone alpha factor receptor
MDFDFDPYNQNITFMDNQGNPFNVSIPDINFYVQTGVQTSINYGVQTGASIVTLVVLLLLTRPDKRRSAVFLLNTLALVLNISRLICQVLYFTSDFFMAYQFFAEDFSQVPTSAYATSILGIVFAFLLVVCIEASLVLQAMVVCSNMRDMHRRLILCVSVLVGLFPVGFRLGMLVENAKSIVRDEPFWSFIWLQSANTIVLTISICFFCGIFVLKLGYSIRKRHQLGLKQFGPMQAIFIMGCQTMIVPGEYNASLSGITLTRRSNLFNPAVCHVGTRNQFQHLHSGRDLPACVFPLGSCGASQQAKASW